MTRSRALKKKRRRKAFSEMDQGLIGLVGLIVVAVALAGALNIGTVLSVLGQTTYTAEFAETGGLRTGDDVRVAGIRVGKVNDIDLKTDHVSVTFGVENVDVGNKTRAVVKADNALGSKFLALELDGSGTTHHIPLERTDAGFSVNEELGNLTRVTGEIDEDKLAKSFKALTSVLAQTPDEFRSALKGVSALSHTISSRDQDLETLLKRSSSISEVLADRNQQVTSILSDGSLLFRELELRREVLSELFANIQVATRQLRGLVHDNKTSLNPALTELKQTAELLSEYRGTLDFAIKNLSRYVRSLGEAVAGGPFFQAYVANLQSPEDLGTGAIKSLVNKEGGGF